MVFSFSLLLLSLSTVNIGYGALVTPLRYDNEISLLKRIKWPVGKSVKTTSGLVHGHAAALASDVSEYLGIPFAQSTAGELRWAPPKRYEGTGDLPGDNYPADCPLPPGSGFPAAFYNSPGGRILKSADQANHTFGENCLGLNIWTKPQCGEKGKAVLVWIYGGGFTGGSSNATIYNGAFFADREDVVVVTFNYRLSFLGFAAPPGEEARNFGLLDQRIAVEWVRDNIASFGGDPNRITLFGESAGGVSVDLYAYAYKEDPIVNGFIAESGAYGVITDGVPDATGDWYAVSEKAGCGGESAGAEASLSCMRGLSFEQVNNATVLSGRASFLPVIDNVTLFSNRRELGAAGEFAHKPMLVGNNSNEGGLYMAFLELLGASVRPGWVDEINLFFACASANAAKYREEAGVPVWRYRYYGDWKNFKLTNESGAYHSAEIEMAWDTWEAIVGPSDEPNQKKVSRLMNHAWAVFAKDPVHGLEKLHWPKYETNGDDLIRLAYNNSPIVTFDKSTRYDDERCATNNASFPV